MKRWHLSGYVFLAVVAALLLSVAVGAPDTCEKADALYNLKLYDEAHKAYIELLKNNTDLTCAQSRINKSRQKKAEEFYNLGEVYREARQYELARKAYIEALKINSSYNESHEALAWVSGDPFAAVRTLADMGLYTEAGERFKEVIEENPGIDVPEELEYLLGGKIFFWRLPWWIWPMDKLIIAVLVMLQIRNLLRPRLDIEDFDKGATNLEIGKGLAAMVEMSFKQIGESGAHGSRPSLIAGPIEKFEIPADVMSKHPYIKIVYAFIEWLLRTDVYTLSGHLQKPGGDLGAGLTLSLVRKKTGEIMANETIWQKDFDPAITPSEANGPAPYYRLAEPAAIWTLFQDEAVRDKLSLRSRIKRWFMPKLFKKKFALLGTSDWLSFAYFRAGVRWTKEDRNDKAQKLYVEALNRDMNNRGALFNLGALDTEAGKEYDRAIKRLQMAREKYLFSWSSISESDKSKLQRFLVDKKKVKIYEPNGYTICFCKDKSPKKSANKITRNKKKKKITCKINDKEYSNILEVITEKFSVLKDRVWYNATYQLAATYHYQSMQEQDEAKNLDEPASLAKAKDEAENLVATIQKAIIADQKNEDTALWNFLESFKPMAVIMYAEILAGNKEEENRELTIEITNTKSDFTKLTYKTKKNGIKTKPYSAKLTYRSHYNLACYYSIVGEKKDEECDNAYNDALRHLKWALERGGGIVQWAKKDPSLKGLRKDKKCEFDELIKKYSAPVTPSADLLPLAGLRVIGETYAKQLKEQGIVSHDDLILRADTREARQKLAKNLCININFLQRWALLADMMRIVGIDTQYANLLEAAGVCSRWDLANIPYIDKLVGRLHRLNTTQCLVKQHPSVEKVKQWKEDATKIKRLVWL
jgi:tetratricopeptide (TPR) repeat protein